MLALERRELAETPQAEVAELARKIEAKGLWAGAGPGGRRTADRA